MTWEEIVVAYFNTPLHHSPGQSLTDWLTPWSTVLLQKLTVIQSRNSPPLKNSKVHYRVHKSPWRDPWKP